MVRAREVASRVFAETDDSLGHRFVVKHGVKLDDAMDVGEGDAEGITDRFLRFPGGPAEKLMGFVQGREEHRAATGGDGVEIGLEWGKVEGEIHQLTPELDMLKL
jgi:hypothetical protein